MFNYDRNMVIAALRAAHPSILQVTDAKLREFDDNLFQFYDEELRKQAEEREIPINKFNLSMLVFFATRSTAQLVKTRVRHACTYFLSARPEP